jgi:hypothetical protein
MKAFAVSARRWPSMYDTISRTRINCGPSPYIVPSLLDLFHINDEPIHGEKTVYLRGHVVKENLDFFLEQV